MSMEILEGLLGGSARVKLMKLFLFHPEILFEKSDIVKRTKCSSALIQKEIKSLIEIDLIKKKTVSVNKQSKNGRIFKKKAEVFVLNPLFKYLNNLKGLLINNEQFNHGEILRKINKAGKIKLTVISGIFIQNDDSRVDILIVGDELKERMIKKIISDMESEIGKELRYSVFSSSDFKYRYSVCDRLVRDIFDYPHQIIVDRIGI
jgi:hypothetical protein